MGARAHRTRVDVCGSLRSPNAARYARRLPTGSKCAPLARALCSPRARGARAPYAGRALPLALIVASPARLWAFRVRASGGFRAPPIPASARHPHCPQQGYGSLLWGSFSYVHSLEPKPAESLSSYGLAQFVVWAAPPDFAAPAKGAGRVRRRLPLSGSCRGRGTRGASGHGALPLSGTAVVASLPFFFGYRPEQRYGAIGVSLSGLEFAAYSPISNARHLHSLSIGYRLMMGAERPAPTPLGRPYDGSDFCLTTYCRGAHWHPRHPRLVFFMVCWAPPKNPDFASSHSLGCIKKHKKP